MLNADALAAADRFTSTLTDQGAVLSWPLQNAPKEIVDAFRHRTAVELVHAIPSSVPWNTVSTELAGADCVKLANGWTIAAS
jgi:hypothetical protein